MKKYTEDHEWIELDGDTGIIGISNYAQGQLGDVVFVELPKIGAEFEQGDEAAVVESVKAASEIFCPIGGKVIEINETLVENPQAINEDAEGEAWFFKIKVADDDEMASLMDEDDYKTFLEGLK